MLLEFTYNYTREALTTGEDDGQFNINNANYVDLDDSEITLAEEIETLMGKECNINSSGSSCIISFAIELTPTEKSTLDTVVANYKLKP